MAISTDVTKPTLYVCHVDEKGEKVHPCAKAHAALRDAGVDHDKIVYGKGQPFGIGVKGKRPDIKAATGQEKLPVLILPAGDPVVGGKKIVKWAEAQAS